MRTRDRYIDLLRALALIRVVTFHTFGWVWLPAVFPSIGIMFALAGALVASSLDRASSTGEFWRKRLRRLLPPFYVFGAVMLVIMFWAGWSADGESGGVDFSWTNLWLWVFPLADPPGSDLGYDWVQPLWYIRAYLWFLLLSPALLWVFRRWPLRTMAVPAVLLPLMVLGLVDFPDPYWDIVATLCVYGICWMLGFAHHDGKLRQLPMANTLLVGVTLMAGGLWVALASQETYGSWNIDDNPIAALLYFTGAVLILLRLYTTMDWLGKWRTLEAVISLINSRAMTIYLWNNFAIFLAPTVLALTPLAVFDTDDLRGQLVEYAAAWVLILGAILLVGWVEDLSAAKRPRLLPFSRTKRVKVFSEGQAQVPAGDGARSGLATVAGGSPRSASGNFVVDPGSGRPAAANGSRPETGTAVLTERPTELADLGIEDDSPEAVGAPAGRSADVRANFVIDEVTDEEAEALERLRPGPEDTEFADPDPMPITVHVDQPAVVMDAPPPGGEPAAGPAGHEDQAVAEEPVRPVRSVTGPARPGPGRMVRRAWSGVNGRAREGSPGSDAQ